MSILSEKGLATRQRILAEATRLLVAQGYEALVMRDLAQRCEMKLGNLQYYFKTLEELVYAIIEAEAEKDLATINGALTRHGSPEDLLDAVIEELVGRWRRKEGAVVYSVLNLLQLHSPSFRQLYKETYANHYEALERVIAHLTPGISQSDCRTRARLLTALIDGAAYQVVPSGRPAFLKQVAEEARAIALKA